jgi:hypothetical protein
MLGAVLLAPQHSHSPKSGDIYIEFQRIDGQTSANIWFVQDVSGNQVWATVTFTDNFNTNAFFMPISELRKSLFVTNLGK